jgi:hypothetical protein
MSLIPCPINADTPEQLVEVLRRFLPPEYLDPMEPPGTGAPGAPGWEVILAASQALSRVSAAAERLGCGLFFLTAPSGELSTATVTLTRASTSTGVLGVFTVKAGSSVVATSGRIYFTSEDVTFGATDLSVSVPVVSSVAAYWLNTAVVAGVTTVPVTTTWSVGSLTQDPPFSDTTITVDADGSTDNGVSPFLELLGNDRGLTQYLGESDEAFRLRCRTLPDTITPGAIQRMLTRIFGPQPAGFVQSFEYHDLWAVDFQTGYDMPMDSDPVVFVYDDPRPYPPSRNRYLPRNYLQAFVVSLANNSGSIANSTYGSFTDQLAAIKAAGVAPFVLWENT